MSRNLYKLIQSLQDEVKLLNKKISLLENQCDHLETLLRIKDKAPYRPVFPQTPWYSTEPSLKPPYKVTCKTDKELEDDPFIKLLKNTFDL